MTVFFFSCNQHLQEQEESMSEKLEPYDNFSFQRSYPDTAFHWAGWRRVIQETRLAEQAQDRGNSCGSNLTNWTIQGPMNVGGRCNTLAMKPDDEHTLLAGFAAGGIFKSTDGAVNWTPVFDANIELSIGDITFSRSNPNIVYAGTGDPNMPSILFNGDGIFKSTDAGETWQRLPQSPGGIISKVVVHPSDPNTLWAASMGNPYIRDQQRGVYKSTDGGQTWQAVLFVSNQAGASDLVQSPADPQILYASFWDRVRSNQESIVYGPHARVYKSADGGDTWTQMGGGLPTGVLGRTGLAISWTNPNKVYAVYIDSTSRPTGLYKTTDGGNVWNPVNISQLEDACSDFGWFFGKIHLNPTDDEDIYFHAILLWRKQAGSNSWFVASGGHADSHDLVFTPSGRRYWSNDGGVYRNTPGQQIWPKSANLPVTQFYRTTFNPHEPNQYWAGAQDNGIQKGNAQSINGWTPVFSADGFHCAFDPNDPQHFWVEIQNGTVHETSNGGNSWQFGTRAFGTNDRTNWDAPFFMSPHLPNRLYAATYRAYAKDAGGGWGVISGDLTDGVVYEARFHTVSCLQESPLTVGRLVAGTSDGNVWRRDAVGNWTKITAGLPDRYVTSVRYSPTVTNRIFVTHSGFRDNENIPHIHRSDDQGATWQNISGNLPPMPVNDLFILPGHADQVLIAASDVGVYFTLNGGTTWSRLGGNMPIIPVFDFEHNPVRRELVAATFARGIWTFPLDSIFVQQNPVTVSLSGQIQNEAGQGVESVQMGGMLSQANGTYQVNNVPGCAPLVLEPFRNDNPLNGITTFDLVLISKHLLGLEPLNTPYKIIAADANQSGSVTTFDIVQLRKLILGIDTVLANNTSWRFVPTEHVFPNVNNPFEAPFPETLAVQVMTNSLADLNFTALKVGDLNQTAVPNFAGVSDTRTEGIWPLFLRWERASHNPQTITALLSASGAQGVESMQFSLQFDPAQLEFDHLEFLLPGMTVEHVGTQRAADGQLSFSYIFPPDEIRAQERTLPLFQVVFREKIRQPKHTLRITNQPTPALAYRADATVFRPEIVPLQDFNTLSIQPNPFGAGGCWITSTPGAWLSVWDVEGRLVFRKKQDTSGIMHLTSENFPKAGVYFWRVENQSGKVIFAP